MIFSEMFWQPIALSLKVAVVAVIVVLVIGVCTAWLMTRKSFKGHSVIETVLLLPIVLPPTVVGFLLVVAFGQQGFIGQLIQAIFQQSLLFTVAAAMLAAAIVAFPLMYQSVKLGFQAVDKDIEDAARVDGAGELAVFGYITLPISRKAVLAGVVLSFARAIGEFGATLMFAGNIPGKTQTISTAIYVAMETNQMELAWAWVIGIILLSFTMLFLIRRFAD
ncbi:molybdate ABC transporter permease subunit [Radiobacillus sp. PE A8.2]|uniref:molybdate ABC transporter permease subunit n=1 Tax=Radiobacillus sp. PE A8.2 TaxID=3380349 RepID=UPI00388DA0BE